MLRYLFCRRGRQLDRIEQHLAELAEATRIYMETLMSQQDDINAALAKLTQAVTDLSGRIPTIDVPATVGAINALADQVNAIAAPVTPPPAG